MDREISAKTTTRRTSEAARVRRELIRGDRGISTVRLSCMNPLMTRAAWIADDDAAIQQMIKRTLAEAGYDARCFDDAEEVLAWAVGKPPPALIVADIMMPGMSGLTLVRTLRSRKPFAHVPVIIATARAEVRDATEAMRLGAVVLRKPFRLRDLMTTVERLVEDVSPVATP